MGFSGILKMAVFMGTVFLAVCSSSAAIELEPAGLNLSNRVVVKPSEKDGVKTIAVTVGPFPSREECRQELDKILKIETIKYTQAMFQDNYDRPSELPTIKYLREKLVSAELFEQSDQMFTFQVELKFSKEVQAHLKDLRKQAEEARNQKRISRRLLTTGLGTTGVLVLLGILFGYLKWTAPKSGNSTV